MEIYVDVLVILNTYLTWILLNLTGALTKTVLKPIKCAAASFLGGISALIIMLPDDVKLIRFTSIILKILSGILIIFIAFYGVKLKKLLILFSAFMGVSMVLSGGLMIVENLLNTPSVALPGGYIYFDVSPVNLVLSTAGIYFSVCIFWKLYDRNLGRNNSYRVDFKIGCKAFSLDGFADTGNNARDIFSGLPVIICTGIEISEGSKMRIVPYKTVSGEGILYAFFPDSITVTEYKKEPCKVSALVAGIDPGGEQRAVFNPAILK